MINPVLKASVAAAGLCLLSACLMTTNKTILLFTYFLENGDGLHLAYSLDGYQWTPIKKGGILLKPAVGSMLMRDPSLLQGPDKTFHLVWTTGWDDKGFGYASSKDLINWSEQRFIPINEKLKANNTWAPEIYYERKPKLFHIFWATTIPGLFPETDNGGDRNHRLYSTTTRDFVNFTEPKIFFNPGYNCIDGTLIQADSKYYLFFKDERVDQKTLRVSTASSIGGQWSEPSDPIANLKGVEGPSAIQIGDEWLIYFDHYQDNQYYGALRSRNLKQWEDVTSKMSFPKGMRHGTVISISRTVLDDLLKL